MECVTQIEDYDLGVARAARPAEPRVISAFVRFWRPPRELLPSVDLNASPSGSALRLLDVRPPSEKAETTLGSAGLAARATRCVKSRCGSCILTCSLGWGKASLVFNNQRSKP